MATSFCTCERNDFWCQRRHPGPVVIVWLRSFVEKKGFEVLGL